MMRLIDLSGWVGALLLCIAPPIIDSDLGKILASLGLAILCLQAWHKECYNLIFLNIIGIGGYLYALYFDLDGTVIDSSHRLGDSLDDWRRMNTPDNIAADSCLPLFDQMLDAINDGLDVIICTSRNEHLRLSMAASERR